MLSAYPYETTRPPEDDRQMQSRGTTRTTNSRPLSTLEALSKHSQRNLEALSKKSQNNIKNISKQSLKKAATTFDLTQPCSIKLLAGNARETRHMALNESKDLVGTGY